MGRIRARRKYEEWAIRVPEAFEEKPPRCQPGVLDDVARQIYLGGQTAFLALVLHDRTGGQIWGSQNRRRKSGQRSNIPGHFAVETEPGMVTDIDGTRSLGEWNNLQGAPSISLSRQELRDWQRRYQPRKQWRGSLRSHQSQYHLAESFAEQLLRR